MRIVFFGTPAFAASILDFLLKKPIEIVAIVTKPDKPKGRSLVMQPTAVKLTAQNNAPHIPFFQPPKASAPEFAEILQQFKADLFVVVAYSEIIKENLLQMPRLGCINIHASLLPKYRGAAPIQRCLIAGEQESGVTIIKMVKELDAGDMLAAEKCHIPIDMDAGELSEALCQLGQKLVWQVIQNYANDQVIAVPQNHAQATFAPKVNSADGLINWSKPAVEIHNLIRGLTPRPGAWCIVNIKNQPKRIIIKKTQIINDTTQYGNSGSILEQPGLVVSCGQGALKILELQLEGRKSIAADEFIRGFDKNNLIFP